MTEPAAPPHPEMLPTLLGQRVTLRPGTPEDVAPLHAILSEPSVTRWWGEPAPPDEIATNLRGEDDTVLLVIAIGDAVVGGIQYSEERDPMYHAAAIDLYLTGNQQQKGLGSEALMLLVRFLLDVRHHHRLTIDPATDNARAIRCYTSVGFRSVGIMRQYERGPDGVFHDGLLMDLLAADLPPQPVHPSR